MMRSRTPISMHCVNAWRSSARARFFQTLLHTEHLDFQGAESEGRLAPVDRLGTIDYPSNGMRILFLSDRHVSHLEGAMI